MRMKIAWLPALIFCATLALAAAKLDFGPFIQIAQCRSMCLRHHMVDGNCWEINKIPISDCQKCWDTCEHLGFLEKEEYREDICTTHSQDCQGCETACTFFQTRGMEEEKYEPIKLPAPEENETIRMNDYDVAVLMNKNLEGMWEEENYYYAKQQPTMIPGGWVIVVAEDGVVRHYSWEKWRPKLETLKAYGPLYQAYITWHDWRTQLNNQRERISSNYFKTIFEHWAKKERHYKSSFVVTWQQETGDGVMGNQVTDSESAQISLPCDDPAIVGLMGIVSASLLGILYFRLQYLAKKYRIKIVKWSEIEKESKIEEGRHLTETEKRLMKERNLTKMQKKLMNQGVLRLCSNYSHPPVQLLRVKETDINVNASVKVQDASASTQGANANVIQET
ncbi:uncharacterized protein LOC143896938 isoform X2 [Temnothorax americanus]|uniref:uncharacterized protein LOC143896938 isoform X2 n=1 Tax=Temnothorax americanus TaxID=1964332 RepID=UPI004068C13C